MKRAGLAAGVLVAASVQLLVAQQPNTAAANTAPSDELNKALPKWLRFSGEYRARLEGFTGSGFKTNSDLYLLSRLRLNMKIRPASWLKFQFQAQDSRVFWKNQKPPAPPYQNTMDLRQAFVELGDTENRAFGVRVGRQELAFGEERLIGNVNWLNTARSFDAVRATVRHDGYRLDAFASSVVIAQDGEFDRHQEGNNLHGLYGGMEKLVPKATIEPYVFWRLAPGVLTENGVLSKLDSKTTGFRWVGQLPANFDYGTEMAKQIGSVGNDRVDAWAGHWTVGYTAASVRYKPHFVAEYNYASGDSNPHDGRRGTFDQLYPTGHDKYGLADQVGWRNIEHIRTGVELKPHAKWLVISKYSSWWLASPRDALYTASGTVIARVPDGSAGRHVGQEWDSQAVYSVAKTTQIGCGFAHIFPGEFLKRATPGRAYNYPYLLVNYLF